MLWYKGWLETRFRFLFVLGLVAFFLGSAYSRGANSPATIRGIVGSEWFLVAVLSVFIAGAGIATQPALQATKGIHGSMLFTLSLPVSRFRLLAVRSGLGWIEMVGGIGILCCGMWFLLPELRGTATPLELVQHTIALIVCATGLYSIPVLLATFLDDVWRIWGSIIVIGSLTWLFNHTPMPPSANFLRAMAEGSPLLAHTMPWTAMAVSLGFAAILFFAALNIAQRREY
jgi:hypothetical protein